MHLYRLQRPNQPHYVITLQHSVAVGHHFYATSCVQHSVHQVTHSLVRRGLVTNDSHIEARMLLRRMLTTWVDWYLQGDWESGEWLVFCFALHV